MTKRKFEDIITEQGRLIYTHEGDSMYPTILPRDLLLIEPVKHPLKKYDIPLYKRKNGQYVLHRIVEVKRDSYTMKGDNRDIREKGVTDHQIIGVLTGIIRGGKRFPAGKPLEHQRMAAMDLIYLLSCAVNGDKPDAERCGKMDLIEIYRQSRQQMLSSAVSYALETVIELPRPFDQAKKKAIRKLALFEVERAAVLSELNAAGIWYLPLKGILLKNDYPKAAMREMSDNDILVDPQRMKDVRRIMERLGYSSRVNEEYNHDVYCKPPALEFEMHRALFDKDEAPLLSSYYADIEQKLSAEGDGCARKMTDEDFYLYLISHSCKHFSFAGTGLRSLLDVYVFLRSHSGLDKRYLNVELQKLKLTTFESKMRTLARKVFSNASLNDSERRELDYFIFSGSYGNAEYAGRNQITRNLGNDDSKNAKLRYWKNRVFPRGAALRESYPFVYKHKLLYPLLLLYRPAKGVLTHPKGMLKEYKAVKNFRKDNTGGYNV